MSGRRIIVLLSLFWFGMMGAKGFNYSDIVLDHVVIQGSSNISDFMLTYINDQSGHHNLSAFEVNDSTVYFNIPVDYITASNRVLVSDFRDLIKAKNYPYIVISISKRQIEAIAKGKKSDNLKFDVTIAGHSNTYSIPFFVGRLPGSYEYVMGKTNLQLTDYNLEPAKKIFGLIKISNEVFINFRINFKSS